MNAAAFNAAAIAAAQAQINNSTNNDLLLKNQSLFQNLESIGHNPALMQFMSPAAVAAAYYALNNKSDLNPNLIPQQQQQTSTNRTSMSSPLATSTPVNPSVSPSSLYQRSYLDAYRLYKAAYNANSNNQVPNASTSN